MGARKFPSNLGEKCEHAQKCTHVLPGLTAAQTKQISNRGRAEPVPSQFLKGGEFLSSECDKSTVTASLRVWFTPGYHVNS